MATNHTLKGACIAEFLGTGLLIFFGCGCVAAAKLAGAAFGLWEISIVWGIGVAMAVYCTAGVSGAHLNPAVTIALWKFACFDGKKVIPYIIAQMAGAFVAAALIYLLYQDLFAATEAAQNIVRGETVGVANVFSTYPHPNITFYILLCEDGLQTATKCIFIIMNSNANYYLFRFGIFMNEVKNFLYICRFLIVKKLSSSL